MVSTGHEAARAAARTSHRPTGFVPRHATNAPALNAPGPQVGPVPWLSVLGWLAVLGAAPQLDADASLAGAVVGGDAAAVLPHGRGVGDVLDVGLIAPISSSLSGGGIDLFDPLWLSVHGYSWTQLHHFWGEVALDDPAAAGQPMLQLPIEATAGLTLTDVWGAGPSLSLLTPTLGADGRRPVNQLKVHAAGAHDVGGASWMAPGLFDREPAYPYGAPRARRALVRAKEARASSTVQVADGTLMVLAEHLEHAHRYLDRGPDAARRDTALLAFGRSLHHWPSQIRLAYQRTGQSAAGAAFRWPDPMAQRTLARAWALQVETGRAMAGGARVDVALGLAARGQARAPHATGPRVDDVLDPWLWLSRPAAAQHVRSTLATAKMRWLVPLGPGPAPAAPVGLTRLVPAAEAPAIVDAPPAPAEVPLALVPLGAAVASAAAPGATLALELEGRLGSYVRGQAADRGPQGTRWQGTPVALAVLEPAARPRHAGAAQVAELRGQLGYRHVFAPAPPAYPRRGPRALDAVGGVQIAHLATPTRALLRAAPRLGVALRAPAGPFAAFLALRREPEAVTSQLTDALGGDGTVGHRAAWTDANGDGLPQAEEAGAAFAAFGGATVRPGAKLRVPAHHLLQLGLQLPLPRGWSTGVRGTMHLLRRRYALVADAQAATGTARFVDPGGDGRGERRGADGRQHLAVREVWPDAGFAAKGAQLVNGARLATYYGVELELHSPPQAPYFVDVTGAAYLSRGEAPFGNGPDRNDPGILAPEALGPNADLHGWGRYDHDRSFALKVQAGIRPVEGLSLALSGRYRDGQPFTRLAVVEGLTQGPEAVAATGRGGARYTFRMVWDARLRYATTALRPLGVTVVADVYNLLGSATEIDEDPRTGGTFRRALEVVPGRSAWIGVELAFLP